SNTKKNKNIENSEENNNNIRSMIKPSTSAIGEIKVNIDDIKSGLLSYYSNIFSLDHYDIESRLNILKYGDKCISDSLNVRYTYSKQNRDSNAIPLIYKNDNIINLGNSNDPLVLPSTYPYYNNQNDYLKNNNIYSNLEKKEFINQFDINENDKLNYELDNEGKITNILTSLKRKCENAKFKTDQLNYQFNKKYENPDNRCWIYDLVPAHLRRPGLDDNDGLRQHIITTYAQLYNEAMLNKKKISALEKKLHLLKVRSTMFEKGMKVDTRNAL
ncbi:conserved protein, unknown function, partial [Hepatocystis sp. ex Piliocolobus tephrosceles]